MLKRMMKRYAISCGPWPACLVVLAAALALSACAGAGGFANDKYAWRVEGGALTEYGGADGEDADARNTLRLVLVGRQFDITPLDSHTVETGESGSFRAGADADFADATGAQTQFGDEMTLEFAITSANAAITDMELRGVFAKSLAEAAVADPANSFEVAWTLSYNLDGEPRELTAKQTLIGINFILD